MKDSFTVYTNGVFMAPSTIEICRELNVFTSGGKMAFFKYIACAKSNFIDRLKIQGNVDGGANLKVESLTPSTLLCRVMREQRH